MKTPVFSRRKQVARWRGAYSYRIPMQIRLYIQHWHRDCYPICPRCERSLERDFLGYCYHCGQKLGWDRLNEVCFIKAGDKTRKIYGIRRAWLTVTRNEDTERLYITVPRAEGLNRYRISERNRTQTETAQPEQFQLTRRKTGDVSGLSVVR